MACESTNGFTCCRCSMKRRATLLFAALLFALAAALTWLILFRPTPHVNGPLRHEVYVWQRAWTEPVRNAIAQHATNFSALTFLKAEVSWKDRKPQVMRVSPDYATLAQAQRPVGIALRIGPYAGPFAGAPSPSGTGVSPVRTETHGRDT